MTAKKQKPVCCETCGAEIPKDMRYTDGDGKSNFCIACAARANSDLMTSTPAFGKKEVDAISKALLVAFGEDDSGDEVDEYLSPRIPLEIAVMAAERGMPEYNEFQPQAVAKVLALICGCGVEIVWVVLGREGSPVMYVGLTKGTKVSNSAFGDIHDEIKDSPAEPDEIDISVTPDGYQQIRVWWD